MDIGDVIALMAVIISVISSGVAAYFAAKANKYSQISADEAQNSTEAAERANEIATESNAISESANETANKALALQRASNYFPPIDTCTRILNSMNTCEVTYLMTAEDCKENLRSISAFKSELKVLDGAAFKNQIAANSIALEGKLADELARYNQMILDLDFDLNQLPDTLLYGTNLGFKSTITTMSSHLPILRSAFNDAENGEAWNAVRIDHDMLRQALQEFSGDMDRLLRQDR